MQRGADSKVEHSHNASCFAEVSKEASSHAQQVAHQLVTMPCSMVIEGEDATLGLGLIAEIGLFWVAHRILRTPQCQDSK